MRKIILIIILLVLIICGAFYWYSWRPAQIRKQYTKVSSNGAIQITQFYQTCLRQHGLEK